MAFLTFNNFFLCVFKNANQKNICAFIIFKAESKPKQKENFFGAVFFKDQKCVFSGVQNGTFKKSNFKIVFLCLFFDVKGSSMPIFTNKY